MRRSCDRLAVSSGGGAQGARRHLVAEIGGRTEAGDVRGHAARRRAAGRTRPSRRDAPCRTSPRWPTPSATRPCTRPSLAPPPRRRRACTSRPRSSIACTNADRRGPGRAGCRPRHVPADQRGRSDSTGSTASGTPWIPRSSPPARRPVAPSRSGRRPRGRSSPPPVADRQGAHGCSSTGRSSGSLVDVLLTNFHLPRTSLLLMIDAHRSALARATRRRWPPYRFLSFGDAMLLQRRRRRPSPPSAADDLSGRHRRQRLETARRAPGRTRRGRPDAVPHAGRHLRGEVSRRRLRARCEIVLANTYHLMPAREWT